MKAKSRTLVIPSALVFAFFWSSATVVAALDVSRMLDKLAGVEGAGLPYGTCVLVAGLSVSAVALYSALLVLKKWNEWNLLLAIRAAVGFSAIAAVLCTVWFVVKVQVMNPAGLLGLGVCLATATWVISVCNYVLWQRGRSKSS